MGTVIYLFHETLRFPDLREKRDREALAEAAGKVTPPAKGPSELSVKLRLQAAERFALYLERINPGRLVMRLHRSGMTAAMLQNEILRTIREEFDHNLSRQVYVSEGAWELIKNARQ